MSRRAQVCIGVRRVALAAGLSACFLAGPAAAGWFVRYDGGVLGRDAWMGALAPDTAGVVVYGTSAAAGGQDVVVRRYGSSGTPVWTLRYDGVAAGDDRAYGGAPDASGDLYVTGESAGDLLLLKVSPSGALTWARTFDGTASLRDFGKAVAVAPNGDVFVAGATSGSTTATDWILRRYSPAGGLLWSRTVDGSQHDNDVTMDVVARADGGAIVAGILGDTLGFGDFGVASYDAAGTRTWLYSYDGPAGLADWLTDLAVDASGAIYVCGFSGAGAAHANWTVLKLSSAGTLVWERHWDSGFGWDGAAALAIDAASHVYVGGTLATAPDSLGDYQVVKYSAAGDTVWTTTFAGPSGEMDEPTVMRLHASGDLYVTGAGAVGPGQRDAVTVRIEPGAGAITGLWGTNASQGDFNLGTAIAADPAGTVYMAGAITDAGGNTDALLQRLGGPDLVEVEPGEPLPRVLALTLQSQLPARDRVDFQLDLPSRARVSAEIVDAAGRRRSGVFFRQTMPPGRHSIRIPLHGLASGVYFFHLQGEGDSRFDWSRKIVVLR